MEQRGGVEQPLGGGFPAEHVLLALRHRDGLGRERVEEHRHHLGGVVVQVGVRELLEEAIRRVARDQHLLTHREGLGGGGAEHQVRVVFNEPIKYNEAAGSKIGKVVLSKVSGSGNSTITALATSVVRSNTNITGANNTMIFRFTPTSGDAGTYKVAAAAAGIANGVSGTLTIKGLNNSEAANVVITGAVSNAAILTITAHS